MVPFTGFMRLVVLGVSGMLGSMVLRCLSAQDDVNVCATARDDASRTAAQALFPAASIDLLDAEQATDDDLVRALDGATWAINAIGVIRSRIRDAEAADVERAIRVNALFPHRLARAAVHTGTHVLQIATDCVYSGARGRYVEADEHDPRDVYGRTKSLGEARLPSMTHLRCSIVGPELSTHQSLLDWFLGQPPRARVRGFTNHLWNGVTSLHFAKLCLGVMRGGLDLPGLLHVVPGDTLPKSALLAEFARAYGRTDVTIEPVPAPVAVDRTIDTSHPEANRRLWAAAGYAAPPTLGAMVMELAEETRGWPPSGAAARAPGTIG